MDENIINNEELIQAAEAVAKTGKNGWVIAGIVTAGVGAVALIVDKLVVPMVKNHKAKKAANAQEVCEDDFESSVAE